MRESENVIAMLIWWGIYPMEHYIIEEMSPVDGAEVCRIFHEGMASGDLIMDADDPEAWMDMNRGQNMVARFGDQVVGWAMATPLEDSEIPEGIARISVFVDPSFRGKGLGRLLLNTVIGLSKEQGFSSLICGIIPDNVPALMLHKSSGFHAMGMLREAGLVRGKVRDAVLLRHTFG